MWFYEANVPDAPRANRGRFQHRYNRKHRHVEPLADVQRLRHERYRNQSDEEDDRVDYRRHQTSPIPHYVDYPPMALVCVPPFGFYGDDREDECCLVRRRDEDVPQRKSKGQCRRPTHSSSSQEDNPPDRGIRSQRVRSLQAMAQVQRNAARLIQQEYRFYRNRKSNRQRRQAQLQAQANKLLDVLVVEDLIPALVSDALLAVLRDEATRYAGGSLIAASAVLSYSEVIYHGMIGELVDEVFQVVLDALVREYMMSRLDLARLAQPSSHVVASELVDGWVHDLITEIFPEALSELVHSYIDACRQQEELQPLLTDELPDIAIETIYY